jgi:hypothetical protein
VGCDSRPPLAPLSVQRVESTAANEAALHFEVSLMAVSRKVAPPDFGTRKKRNPLNSLRSHVFRSARWARGAVSRR